MSNQITTNQFKERLKQRNVDVSLSPVFLYPKSQRYTNSNTKMKFRCEHGHIWKATSNNVIYNKRGCPKCKLITDAKHKRLPTKDIINKIESIYGAEMFDLSTIEYTNMNTAISIVCNVHGKITMTASLLLHRKQGCKLCNAEAKLNRNKSNFIDQITPKQKSRYTYDKVNYINTYTPVTITCNIHGDFEQRPATHINDHGCPKCVTRSFSRKQVTWLNHIANVENIQIESVLSGGEHQIAGTRYFADGYCADTHTVYEFHGDAFHGNPNRYADNVKCNPYTEDTAKQLYTKTIDRERQIKKCGYHLVTIWETEFDLLKLPLIDINPAQSSHYQKHHDIDTTLCGELGIVLVDKVFTGFRARHNFRCDLCGDHFSTTLTQRKQAFKKYGSIGCPQCNKNKNSGLVKIIFDELHKSDNTVIRFNNVIQLNDTNSLYVAEFDRDVEGIKSDRKHLINLVHHFKSKNINLLVVFEDEWILKKKLILDKIKHILKLNSNKPVVYARKCDIRTISKTEKNTFLNEYHIQGTDNGQILLGATYNNVLLAVMTFSQPRVALGGKNMQNQKMFELTRFATNTNYRVPGIASKLLKRFESIADWNTIFSFADRRWSAGNLYTQLGFEFNRLNAPSYFYIINNIRKHRWNYRKQALPAVLPNYDDQLTEYQNMKLAGIDRVWDCGTLKYIKHNHA